MKSLVQNLIRLGSANPELRPNLKPILDVLTRRPKIAYGEKVQVVGKFIRLTTNDSHGSYLLEELPIRGKKRLGRLDVETHYLSSVLHLSPFITDNVLRDARIGKGDSFDAAKKKLRKALDLAARISAESSDMEEQEIRGDIHWREDQVWYLNVVPASADPLTVEGKDFTAEVKWTDFKIYSPDSDLHNHDPHYTLYTAKSPAAARKMYKVVSADPDVLKRVSFNDLPKWFSQNKIAYKTNFSQWS